MNRELIWKISGCNSSDLRLAVVWPADILRTRRLRRKPAPSSRSIPRAPTGSSPPATFPSAINPAGTITGYYMDTNGYHGFVRSLGEDENECCERERLEPGIDPADH